MFFFLGLIVGGVCGYIYGRVRVLNDCVARGCCVARILKEPSDD